MYRTKTKEKDCNDGYNPLYHIFILNYFAHSQNHSRHTISTFGSRILYLISGAGTIISSFGSRRFLFSSGAGAFYFLREQDSFFSLGAGAIISFLWEQALHTKFLIITSAIFFAILSAVAFNIILFL